MTTTEVRSPTKGELTRQTILDAAVARFGQDGFRATSVADIARSASVGGTVPYAYFASKDELFLAALDQDASAVIHTGMSIVFAHPDRSDWRIDLMVALLEAVEAHPLAQRVLAGLEPDVTDRVVDIPALVELRIAVAERLAEEQRNGTVRPDIDVAAVGSGVVSIILSLLMSMVQLGKDVTATYTADVVSVFAAAIDPTPLVPPTPPT